MSRSNYDTRVTIASDRSTKILTLQMGNGGGGNLILFATNTFSTLSWTGMARAGSGVPACAFYDSSNTKITTSQITSYNTGSGSVSIPSNAAWLRCDYLNSESNFRILNLLFTHK